MGFMDAVKSVYSNYFNFQGRARRSEYWWFQLFGLLVGIVFYGLGVALLANDNGLGGIFVGAYVIFALASFLPALAVLVRRLHDTGRSGWFYFIAFIPLVGPIILLVFLAGDSKPGENQYGPNPKGV